MDLLTLIGSDTTLKRVATTNGGEFAGACPKCSGKDRFRVWPERGRFWCRHCGWQGDDIQYLRDLRGLSFVEAKAQARGAFPTVPSKPRNTPAPERRSIQPPPADWQAQAREVITTCSAALWSDAGVRARTWLHARGLTDDTLQAWHVGYNPTSRTIAGLYVARGIVIPCEAAGEVWYLNVRQPEGEPKYLKVAGSRAGLFGVDLLAGLADVYVVEGEFDAMLLRQEIGDVADVLTLGAAGGRLADEQLIYLLGAERFHVATDSDEEGEKAAAHWLELVGKRGQRTAPPGGHKDVTDAWQAGVDLRAWAIEGDTDSAPVASTDPNTAALQAHVAWTANPHSLELGQAYVRAAIVAGFPCFDDDGVDQGTQGWQEWAERELTPAAPAPDDDYWRFIEGTADEAAAFALAD